MPCRLVSALLFALTFATVLAVPQKITEVEGITEYRLDNGLQVLLAPDAAKPTVTVNVTYHVGSRHERYGETGMAHLLEHLMFKGSKAFPDIAREQSRRGTRVNGSTTYDRTNYYETFTAGADNLQWALQLEADRMVNANISRKDLDSEMTVVRNEMERNENSPGRTLFEKTVAAVFQWHNYGKPTMGARSDIENVPIEHLQMFYRQYYQPDNATLIVSGKFDPQDTLGRIEREFGRIPRPVRELPRLYTVEPVQDGERTVTLERVGESRLLTVLYRIPAGSHPDNAPLRILAHVMGNSPSGRLYKSLVETRQATSAYASAWSLHDPGVAIVGASMRKEDDPLRVRQQLLSVIEGTATQPVTEAEVTFARQSLLAGMEKTYNDPEQLALALSGSVAQGDWRLLYWQRDALEKISAADVNRVARQYFKPANRTIGEFIPVEKPDRAEIPPAPDLARLLSGYSGRGRVETGEIFDPSPLNLDARTQRGQLANGMQYALLPKKNRGETVQLALQLNLGAEGSLQGKATIAELTGAMLMRGTQKHSREALAAELIRLKTRLGISASGQHVYLTADTNRANVPAVLALIREILREPAFPDAEYRQLIRQALAGIESARNQPESLAYEAFARHLYPYAPADIRYVPTSTENEARLKAATLDELRAFHRDFYGAAQGQLAIVGDFDVEEARRLAEGALGDWRAAQVFERMTEAYRPVAAQTRILATPDKPNAVFRAGLRLPVGEMHPDYPALRMVAYLLGGGFNSSRLATRLRQQEGMSYTVNAVLGASHFDQAGSLSIYAIYAPQYREKLAQAVDEELARIVRDGFSGQELADGKMAFRERLQIALAQDDSLAAALLGQLEQGESFADDAKFAAAIEALSLQDINTVARRYLHADALSRFFAGDFASSAR